MNLTLHLKKEGLSLGLTHRGQGSEAVIQPLHPSGDAGPIEVVSRPKIDSLIVVAEGCAVGKEGVEAQIPVQPAEESGALLPGERPAGGKKSAAYPLDKARIVGPGDRLGLLIVRQVGEGVGCFVKGDPALALPEEDCKLPPGDGRIGGIGGDGRKPQEQQDQGQSGSFHGNTLPTEFSEGRVSLFSGKIWRKWEEPDFAKEFPKNGIYCL
jgi:hypothetical protein